jgi:adenosine deaminase
MDVFCHSLYKAELHAHLHGSIRPSTLLDVMASRRQSADDKTQAVVKDMTALLAKSSRSLADCFTLFDAIHSVVTTEAVVRRIVKEVIEDFANDNVTYLELRTTPRTLESSGGSGSVEYDDAAERYVAVVQDEILKAPAVIANRICVRLLLSINRRDSV